jgi:hypothetical protein
MNLLNEPWREAERRERRERVCRRLAWACYTAACVAAGVAIGMLIK